MFDLRHIKPIHIWVLLILISLMACTETSANFGKYYRGKTLDVNIVKLERLPELLYLTIDSDQVPHYFRIVPSEDQLELVILRVKVENHTATSAIVNIDSQAAELRDFFQGKYFPINVNERVEEIDPPDRRIADRSVVFLWNKTYQDGTSEAFTLPRDFGIDGILVFENQFLLKRQVLCEFIQNFSITQEKENKHYDP